MEECCHKLLDLIPKDREWSLRGDNNNDKRRHGCGTEEKKLELRLGPPGDDEDWPMKNSEIRNSTGKQDRCLLSLGHFSSTIKTTEKKPFSMPPGSNTAVPHSSQKRTAPGPVVGWPPVRSFRKNLASSSSSKPGTESANGDQNKDVGEKPVEPKRKSLLVKINMDGVPIGRKIDLNVYDSYEKLSSAVDDLFRGLVAAQRDSFVGGTTQQEKQITGLMDGNGEYTLVYEDNEGDKMLVGDVPWNMFVSTVKRLRVLNSSELSSALTFGSSKQERKIT